MGNETDATQTGTFNLVFDRSMEGRTVQVGFAPEGDAVISSTVTPPVAAPAGSNPATPVVTHAPARPAPGLRGRQAQFSSDALSYEDQKAMLTQRLNYGYANSPYYVKDIRDEGSEKVVVYTNWQDGQVYVRTYSIGDGNEVTLGPTQAAVARTVYDTIQMSLRDDFTLTGQAAIFTDPAGDYVVRTGKIFQAGSYTDGQGIPFEMTSEELAAAAASFTSVPLDLDHTVTILSGKLGALTRVKVDENGVLFGEVALPKWLDDVAGRNTDGTPKPIKVSTTWDRGSKTLTKLALAVNPIIEDAEIVAAFAQFAGARHSVKDMRDIQAIHDKAHEMHDLAASQGANCGKAKMSQPKTGVAMQDERTIVQKIKEMLGISGQGEGAAANLSATATGVAAGGQGGAQPGNVTTGAQQDAALLARAEAAENKLKTERDERISAQAAAFASQVIIDRRAFPTEKDSIIADYKINATDDANSPTNEVRFSVQSVVDGKVVIEPKKGTRVDAMKARYEARPQHQLTTPTIPSNATLIFSDTTGGQGGGQQGAQGGQPVKISDERKQALMSHTDVGKQAFKAASTERGA
jgi:hypothetical protein